MLEPDAQPLWPAPGSATMLLSVLCSTGQTFSSDLSLKWLRKDVPLRGAHYTPVSTWIYHLWGRDGHTPPRAVQKPWSVARMPSDRSAREASHAAKQPAYDTLNLNKLSQHRSRSSHAKALRTGTCQSRTSSPHISHQKSPITSADPSVQPPRRHPGGTASAGLHNLT